MCIEFLMSIYFQDAKTAPNFCQEAALLTTRKVCGANWQDANLSPFVALSHARQRQQPTGHGALP